MSVKTIRFFMYGMSILTLLAFSNCSRGGHSDPSPTESINRILNFIPFEITGDNTVYLEKVSINSDLIALAVNVKGGKDVFGAAIEITYDGNKINYVSSSKSGSYLRKDGVNVYLKANSDDKKENGTLVIGIFRENEKGGGIKGIDGDGTLMTIVFKAIDVQTSTSIDFNTTNSRLKSSKLDIISGIYGNIADTKWSGGSLSYQ